MRLQAGASAGIIQSRASVQSERVVATSARPSRPFRTALAVVYTSMLLSMQPAIGSAEPLLESQWTPSAFTGMTQQQSKADTADESDKYQKLEQALKEEQELRKKEQELLQTQSEAAGAYIFASVILSALLYRRVDKLVYKR